MESRLVTTAKLGQGKFIFLLPRCWRVTFSLEKPDLEAQSHRILARGYRNPPPPPPLMPFGLWKNGKMDLVHHIPQLPPGWNPRYNRFFIGFDLFSPMLDQEKLFRNNLESPVGEKLILGRLDSWKTYFFQFLPSYSLIPNRYVF
jgi:hypothetical protein